MLRFLPSESGKEEKNLLLKNVPARPVTNIISYVSLGLHVVWIVLFIVFFMNQQDHTHGRHLVEVSTSNATDWWTYDGTSKTLLIHADIVKIGQTKKLNSKRLLKAAGTSKLVIHGEIESSTANIASNILFHGLPIESSFKGAKGDAGPQGVKGDAGAKGDAGPQGVKGGDGPQGAKGDAGAKGDDGAKGDAGTQGVKGDAGTHGAKGDDGTQGAKGAKGDVGPQGAKGANGDAGTQGAKGAKGGAGPQGVKGDAGDKGDAGETGEGVWWTYDKNLKQLNLLTDIVDTGSIIATEFNIKD